MVLDALRKATVLGHRRLEAVMDLDSEALTRPHYAAALQILHAARSGWEPELERLLPGSTGDHRQWLGQDLAWLGVTCLQPAPALLLDQAGAWGLRYVLEGSALGGRVLLRRVQALGASPEAGARYFAGAGEDTGHRWKSFLEQLDAVADTAAVPAIVSGAVTAFEALVEAASARFDEGLDPRQDLAAPFPTVEDPVMANPRL